MDNSPTYVSLRLIVEADRASAIDHVVRYSPHLRPNPFLLSALFENYDEDLKQLLASLKGKLDGDVKALKGGRRSHPVLPRK